MKKRLPVFLIILLLVLVCLSGCNKAKDDIFQENAQKNEENNINDTKDEETDNKNGKPFTVPSFISKDLYGDSVSNSIFEDNKLTILSIWTST